MRQAPNNEKADPKRAQLLIASDDPRCKQSNRAIAEPIRAKDLMETEEPSFPMSNTDNEAAKLTQL
jgi:hypothetical protein